MRSGIPEVHAQKPKSLTELLRLDTLLCFSAYSAQRAFERLYRPMLLRIGLTYPQFLVMMVLWETGELTMKALGEKLMLESSTLTPILKKLEAAGFVRRSRNGDDERLLDIAPTKRGMALQQDGCEAAYVIVTSAGLTIPELEQLRDQLVRVRDSINAATASGGSVK